MDINQNIKSFLEDRKLTQKALAQHLGIATSTINNWIKLKRSIPAEYIIPICEFFDVTPYILLTGQEKSSSKDKLSDDEQELLTYYNELQDIDKGRVLGTAKTLAELKVATEFEIKEEPEERFCKIDCSTYQVSAGAGFELGEGDECYEIKVHETPETRKADFALKIKGNSMEPIYFDGDIVLVKKQPSVDLGEIGIFNVEGNGFIKKFGGDRLISLNAEYDDIVFSDYDEERIQCFGKVIGRV